MVISPLFPIAHASVPAVSTWQGMGAMAYWDIKNSTGSTTAIIEALVAEQGLNDSGFADPAKANMLYITVTHPTLGRLSETTSYNVPFSWSYAGAEVVATNILFPWGNNTRAHNITITWATTTDDNTVGSYTQRNGARMEAPGVWTNATATLIIDAEARPHPALYASNWAIIGINMHVVGHYKLCDIAIYHGRIYVLPPWSSPTIMSAGTFDPDLYGRMGWTAVDAAKPLIDSMTPAVVF
jgi:hypothetical protein